VLLISISLRTDTAVWATSLEPTMETEEPIRANDRHDKVDPVWMASNTDNFPPNRPNDRTERLLPT
jgi:hypothetical protein